MSLSVKCSVFARLSAAALQPGDPDRQPPYPALRSLRLESRNNKQFAIASNRLIMAIDYLGSNEQNDEAFNVSLDLVPPCQSAIAADGVLTVTEVSANWGVATLSTGYFHPGNALIDGAFPDWRKLVPPDPPRKPIGSIAIHAPGLVALANASPSGHLIFPQSFDASQPVLVTDMTDPDWCGFFLALDHRDQKNIEPARIPDWLK